MQQVQRTSRLTDVCTLARIQIQFNTRAEVRVFLRAGVVEQNE